MEDEELLRLLMTPSPVQVPPPCPFAFSEEELLLLSLVGGDGMKSDSTFDKGCLDPELGNRCSPCYSFYRDGADFQISERCVLESSPVKHLLANRASAEFLAKCTRRLFSIDSRSGGPKFATTVALAADATGTAHHALPKDPATSRHASCVTVNAYPAHTSSFAAASRAELKWGNNARDAGADTEMKDPVSDVPWTAGNDAGTTCTMDFEVLLISNNSVRVDGRREIHEFEHIMLPASVTYMTSTVCGVVSFPMVDEALNKLKGDDEGVADTLCSKYLHTVRHEVIRAMKSKHGAMMRDRKNMNEETKLFLRSEGRKELREIVKNLLPDCFGGFKTGEMVCSMGRLIGKNETTLAANYSTLPGSSGGAVFSPHYPPGTFIGIHAGAAPATSEGDKLVYPDYNLATSTDNPAFFLAYFSEVLPRLPLPSAFGEEERLAAFRHYLLKHLRLVAGMELEMHARQGEWLNWAVQGVPVLPLARILLDPQPDPTRRLIQLSEQLLGLSLKGRSKPGNALLPSTLEEVVAALTSEVQREMFFAGIKEVLKSDGVFLQPWGLQVKVNNAVMLVYLACQLL